MTYLENCVITHKEWNKNITPLIKQGVLKDVSQIETRGFVYIHIIMDISIQDIDGKIYRCEGDVFGQVSIKEEK